MRESRAVRSRRRGRHAKPTERSPLSRVLALVLAPTLVLTTIGTGVLLTASGAAADDGTTPTTSVTSAGAAGKDFILAGENATYDISVTNESGDDKFNLSATALVPAGVEFVSASFLGTPKRYLPATPLPNASRTGGAMPATDCVAPLEPVGPTSPLCTVPTGYELWVWQNVSDLPDTATVSASLVVMPQASAFPVGTDDLEITITSYTSNDPTLLPAFDGSTTVATGTTHTSAPGVSSASTDVRALRVTKSEPSPEQELLRGVHNNTTTYTIVVEHTGEGATGGVTVTDYLPAGLEYLGVGGEDNTDPAPYLYPEGGSGTLEYPGAASLAGTPAPTGGTGAPAGWDGTGESVETVELTDGEAAALGLGTDAGGVYTKVTWTLGTLTGGTAQSFSTTEGTPGEYTIRYRAAVPLFENTMDWPGATPPLTGEQGSNLANNTGASTRHGLDSGSYDYAQSMTNAVGVAGSYQGLVVDAGDRSSADDDTVTIEAVDLRVLKSVDINAFSTGDLATYRLDLATSEYTSAAGITLTDEIANGLCPAFPLQPSTPQLLVDGVPAASTGAWNTAVGADCTYPSAAGTAMLTGASVDSIAFTSSDGSFTVELVADPMTAQDTAVVEYTAMQRQVYIPNTPDAPRNGATSSGDVMVNHVEVEGTTTAIAALTGVESASGAPADGDQTVADDSSAEILSDFSGLTKKVLARDETPATADDGDWGAAVPDYGDWVDHASTPFALGDTVWYRVRLEFAENIETRQPKLTDFLPQGVAYRGVTYEADLGSAGSTANSDDLSAYIPGPTVSAPPTGGGVLTWLLGDETYADSSDRFIPMNSWIEFTIEGRVVGQSASSDEVDKPENQAKFQQQNVDGDVFFLRDEAAIDLDYAASMVAKGIRDIDGVPAAGNAFGSDVDGLDVVQGDVVTYRIDVGTPQTDLTDIVVWDALPPGILAADVSNFTAASAQRVGTGAWTESALPGTDFTAIAYDWDDLDSTEQGQINPAMTGRSVVKWLIESDIAGSVLDADPALAIARGVTLGYDVTIPDGTSLTGGPEAEITQDYVNDASITSYAVLNNDVGMNADGTSTLVPVPEEPGQVSTITPTATQFEVPSEGTFDPSDVQVPGATIVKDRITTEILPASDPNNSASQIAQGETVTFQYRATIPAHTSIGGAVLADDGVLSWTGNPANPSSREVAYHVVSSTAPVPGFLTGTWADNGFTFDALTGTLTFPATYQNATATDQVFAVDIEVWIEDRDESTPGYNPDFPNNKTLTNNATLQFDDPDAAGRLTIGDTADVVYIEPSPTLTKTVTNPVSGVVGADGNVTFRLTAGNASGRPTLYDAVVVDCLPAGFSITTPAFAASQGTPTIPGIDCTFTGTGAGQRIVQGSGTGELIQWAVGDLAGGATATLDFTAKVDSTAGGGASYINRAHIVGYTLPSTLPDATTRRGDRATGAEREVTLSQATIDKSVDLASAPVGETVRYTLVATLPANANFYDVTLTDTLPAGVTFAGDQVITYDGWPANPVVAGPVDPNVQNLSWTITPVDIPLHTAERTITIEFDALISSSVGSSVTSVTNSAELAWNTTNDTPSTRLDDDDTAVVTILNPLLGIVKDVKFSEQADSQYRQQAQGGPDRDLTYRVRVTNTGNTPAYHATVTDTVPTGVVVDEATITGGGVLTGENATTGGGTITWTIDGPLEVGAGNAVTFTYDADFAPSANLNSTTNGQGDLLTNTARVTHYESFPRDPLAPSVVTGREYNPTTVQDTAEARALFPRVTLTKAVADTSHTAYVGEPFGWVLTATNNGQGDAQKVVLTDTLPPNWTFTAVTSITIAGTTVASTNPTGPDGGPLVWTFGADAVAGSPVAILAPGQSIVIRYTATPTDPDAITTPGVGSSNPHTNTLSAVTTDRQNATSNATRSHTGPNATDDAFLREADLLLLKEAIGGIVDSGTGQADNLHGLPTGSWVPGQAVVSGDYAQPQWRITVTNQGPDASFGPFTFEDTTTLPTGVTTGAFSARYYSSSGDTTGTALTLTGTGTGADPFVVGSTTTSLAATGTDRIVLIANVTIAADATADATELSNIAEVRGRTYEDPTNFDDNEDEVGKPLTPVADLSIDKVITSPVPPVVPIVDSTITWQITARNLGPSVSVSTLADPITITDTVPAGMTGVTATSNGDWVPTVTRGGLPIAFPAEAGDVITWTYQGVDEMPVGTTSAVSLTGTILASHTGALTNSATVVPGDTPDPVTPNNTDEVTVTPDDSTTMTIVKTRVVPDGLGGWRQADPLTDPDDAFVAGDPVHYQITVTNAGPADARGVTVVDEVPTGLTYQTKDDLVGTWAYAAGGTTSTGTNASWNTFTLSGTQEAGAANETSFVITYDTESTITGSVVNWVEVTADNWNPTDPTGPYDRDRDDTGSTRIVDLGIVKTHTGTGPFTPGTEVEYTLTVTNHGPSATNGVIAIEDSLPVGLSYVATSGRVTLPGGSATAVEPVLSGTGNRVLTWSQLTAADTFDVGDQIVVTFRALTDPELRESATLVNHAEVDGPDSEPDPDPNPNEDDDSITTTATDATMTIVKTVAAGPWLAGTNVTYTLTMENAGPSAVPASVTDTLPTGLTLVSMSGTNWDCSGIVVGATTGTCEYLDATDASPVTQVLHPVGTTTITVVAHIAPTVLTGSALVNEAEVSWTDGSGTTTDDDDESITVTTDADLGIVKSVITGSGGTVVTEPAPTTAGETTWYRLEVTNHGPSDAVGPITVADELPLGVTVPASLTTVGSWTVVPGPIVSGVRQTVTFTLTGGLLANTASDTTRGVAPVIEFEVDIDPSVADGAVLTNDADVSSATPDSNPTNDDDSADILVERSSDLAIVKSHPTDVNGQVVIDQPLDFTIDVTNAGPSIASGIVVTEEIPVGLEVTSTVGPIAGTGWTIDSIALVDPLDVTGGTVVVASYGPTLDAAAPGDAADPLVISTIVRENAVGTSPNHVEVTGAEDDPDTTDNEYDDPLDVLPRVTLVVTKTATTAFQVGKQATYRIEVENLGPHDDPGPIVVEDVLPAGLTFASSPSPGLAVSGQTVSWTVPGLDLGDTVELTLVVNVHDAAYPTVTNVVTVTTPSELTPLSDTDDDETVTVAEADPLAWTGSRDQFVLMAAGLVLLLVGLAVLAATLRARRARAIE